MDAVVCGFSVTTGEGPVTVIPVAGGEVASGRLPALTGDRPRVVDALSGRGDLETVLSGDCEAVQRLGFFARFLSTPATEVSP